MKMEIKKWEDFKGFDKPMLEFILNHDSKLNIRFSQKTYFKIGEKDSIFELMQKLNRDNSFIKEYDELEKCAKKKGNEIMELIYNIIHTEGYKIIEKYEQLKRKYIL